MAEQNTIPAFDHEHGGGMGLASHLVHDHKRMPASIYAMRERERRELHASLHRACYCPDDCACRRYWRMTVCGCTAHEGNA